MTKANGKKAKKAISNKTRRALGARMAKATTGQFHTLAVGATSIPKGSQAIVIVADSHPDHLVAFGPFRDLTEAQGYVETVRKVAAVHYGEDADQIDVSTGWTRADFVSPVDVETLAQMRATDDVDAGGHLKRPEDQSEGPDEGNDLASVLESMYSMSEDCDGDGPLADDGDEIADRA